MNESQWLARLRAGDEAAFRELVSSLGGRLERFARSFTHRDAVVEEAVQETWLAVIRGLDRFEGRSSLRTWVFGILANQARRLAVKERRHEGPSVPDEPEREPGMGANGAWEQPPTPWGLEDPAELLQSRETLAVIETALAGLPEAQRQVVLLRDVEGLSAEEASNILGVTDTHQRVLLHRGRARVRQALDRYLRDGSRPAADARGKDANR